MVTSGCHVGSYKSGRRSLGTDECCYAVECFHPFIFYFFFFFLFSGGVFCYLWSFVA